VATAGNSRLGLMTERDRPAWFQYPAPFLRTVDTGLLQFRPWKILDGDSSAGRMAGLKERFPMRDLFPFALRTDCDDVACWERGDLDRVVVIHDFADPGWEQTAVFETFWDWLRSALEDFIDFEP
jgi:hypothetical protein